MTRFDPRGRGTTELWRTRWTTGWSHLVPFELGTTPYLLSYKTGVGTAAIDRFTP